MKIGPYIVGARPIKVAEVGLNHCGVLENALEMVGVAAECGVDIVKFQTFKADEFCARSDALYATFKQCELPEDAWPRLAEACQAAGVLFMSTPQNYSDLELLLPLGIPAIKVGADDAANYPLLDQYASHGLPLIVSTGMTRPHDLMATVHLLAERDVVFLVCTSQYPCPPEEARVSRIERLRHFIWRAHPSPGPEQSVGFSDHTIGNEAAVVAVGCGATVFEKHFTLHHEWEGPDHRWACEPDQLQSWCEAIDRAWIMRGDPSLELTPAEEEQRRKYQRHAGAQIRGDHGD